MSMKVIFKFILVASINETANTKPDDEETTEKRNQFYKLVSAISAFFQINQFHGDTIKAFRNFFDLENLAVVKSIAPVQMILLNLKNTLISSACHEDPTRHKTMIGKHWMPRGG